MGITQIEALAIFLLLESLLVMVVWFRMESIEKRLKELEKAENDLSAIEKKGSWIGAFNTSPMLRRVYEEISDLEVYCNSNNPVTITLPKGHRIDKKYTVVNIEKDSKDADKQ